MKMPHAKDLVLLSMLAVGAGFAAMLFGVGCEIAPANEKIVITPDASSIVIMGQQEFTVSGGYEYAWSLDHENWGMLSARSGNKTTYTSYYDPGVETEVQTLSVVSTISQVQGSNSSSYYQTAQAIVTHVSANKHVFVTPSTASLKKGERAAFVASGGSDYTWAISDPSWGTLSPTNGENVIYSSATSAVSTILIQILTMTSGDGSKAYATITHEIE